MKDSGERDEARLIADLNDLLQLDHDAVEAYTIAIDMVRDATYRETLVAFRGDHKRHIEELAGLVRERGGLPVELPHPTGPLKLAVQTAGGLVGDDSLLLAFKAVEGQARDKYRRFAKESWPADIGTIIQRAAQDEEKHNEWAERTLESRGVGKGTMPHNLASVLETVHKVIADPLEAVGRTVMQNVGQVVGTTQQRSGGAAPSPLDAVAGMMRGSDDRSSDDKERRSSDSGPSQDVPGPIP